MLDIKQIELLYPENLRPFKKNILREYLQYKILDSIFSSKFAEDLCFMGGTAIHIIHSNNRFSEDLDFDNLRLNDGAFAELSSFIKRRLELEGYSVEVTNSFRGAFRAYIKILKILHESGISNHGGEKLLIQLDAEPQEFAYLPEKTIINKFDVFRRINVVPVDLLLSQKITAIFTRKRPQGRDFYDAIFLLGKTRPDMKYLNAKLSIKDMQELKEKLDKKCKSLDFKSLAKDLRQFLFSPSDAEKILLFPEYIANLSHF